MLIKQAVLEGIARGEITCVFRRWARPRVRAGSNLRTAVGVLEVDAVTEVAVEEITDDDAHAAGLASRDALLRSLGGDEGDPVHRIDLRRVGPDPRTTLRARGSPTREEVDDLLATLERMDRSSPTGAWTHRVLAAVARHPGTPARRLAAELEVETDRLKRNVRKLKEHGLTESLTTGYRLSPRGAALARHLGIDA